MNRALYAAVAALLATAAARPAPSQSTPVPPASVGATVPDTRHAHDALDAGGNPAIGLQERLERGRLSERQKRMVADTDRLLALANELKADMDKTTKDQLSIEVIRKAEEIEKLAKNVKERMKG